MKDVVVDAATIILAEPLRQRPDDIPAVELQEKMKEGLAGILLFNQGRISALRDAIASLDALPPQGPGEHAFPTDEKGWKAVAEKLNDGLSLTRFQAIQLAMADDARRFSKTFGNVREALASLKAKGGRE
jgi:hypothetical protein